MGLVKLITSSPWTAECTPRSNLGTGHQTQRPCMLDDLACLLAPHAHGKSCRLTWQLQHVARNRLTWKMLTSSMPGMVFTPSRLSVLCSRLSSVLVVLCTAFFFLRVYSGAAPTQEG